MYSTQTYKTSIARLAIALMAFFFSSNALLGSAFCLSALQVITVDIHRRSTPLYSSRQSDSSWPHGYTLERNAGPIHPKCRLTENQIHILISKRQKCKRHRQYEDADKILSALNQCGVYLHDKRGKWRADGKKHFGRRSDYVRRGNTYGLLSEKDIAAVSTMVEDRSYAKKRGEFHISDQLGEMLKVKYRVRVDDKNREWFVENAAENENGSVASEGEYVPSPLCKLDHPTHTMEQELKMQIAQQLAERSLHRKKRNYKIADKILNEVMSQYNVVVDDRTKEWKVVLGDDFENDDFVKGAQLSQRSAFVRSGKRPIAKHRHDNNDSITEKTSLMENTDEFNAGLNQDRIDFTAMTVAELKEQLRSVGLAVSGRKADLILRLSNASDENNQ